LHELCSPFLRILLSHEHLALTEGLQLAAALDKLSKTIAPGVLQGSLFVSCTAVGLPAHCNAVLAVEESALRSGCFSQRTQNLLHFTATSASSCDSLTLSQSFINAMVSCPDEAIRKNAFVALRGHLASYDEVSRLCLLRRLIHDCPFSHFVGLLIDCVKDCVQAASRGSQWGLETQISRRIGSSGAGRRLLSSSFNRVEHANGSGSDSSEESEALNVYKSRLLEKLRTSREAMGGKEEDDIETEEGKREFFEKHGGVRAVDREALVDDVALCWQGAGAISSPFWSPIVLKWFVLQAVTAASSSSSREVEDKIEIISAGISLTTFVVLRLRGAMSMIEQGVDVEHARDVLAAFLSDGSGSGRSSDSSSSSSTADAYEATMAPLREDLAHAKRGISEMVSRREKKRSDDGSVVDPIGLLGLSRLCDNLDFLLTRI